MRYLIFLPLTVTILAFAVRSKVTVLIEPQTSSDSIVCVESILAEMRKMDENKPSAERTENAKIVCRRSPGVVLVEISGLGLGKTGRIAREVSELMTPLLERKGDQCTAFPPNLTIYVPPEKDGLHSEIYNIKMEILKTESRIILLEEVLRRLNRGDNRIPPLDEIMDVFEFYRDLVIKRIELLGQHTEHSPQVRVVDEQITFVIESIKQKLIHEINALKIKKELLKREERKMQERVMPNTELQTQKAMTDGRRIYLF